MKPERVNILGVKYSITYMDKPSEVDLYHHDSLWGQVDFWTRTIRIYDKGRPIEDVFHSVMHEIIHVVAEELKLELRKNERHDELDLLALALTDVLFRNGWIQA